MRELGYRVALAGGIGPHNLAQAIRAEPQVLVVGSAITGAENPVEVAKWMSAQLVNPGSGWPPSMKLPKSRRT